MGRRSRCLLSVLLACSTIIIKADENVISINTLLSERSSYLVIDFQSDYQRELNGYIAGSILVSKQEEDVVGFIKNQIPSGSEKVALMSYNAENDVNDILNNLPNQVQVVSRINGNIKDWYEAGGQLELPDKISFDALLASLGNESLVPVTLIDVRTLVELEVDGRLPGSYNIPIADIEAAFRQSPTSFFNKYGFEKPSTQQLNVVLTCKAGGRAKFARKLLRKQGYDKLRVYEGSFLDWKAKNGPLCFDGKQCSI